MLHFLKFPLFFFLQCLAVVRKAFAALEAALMGGNASQVALDFGCCQFAENPDDQVMALVSMSLFDRRGGY